MVRPEWQRLSDNYRLSEHLAVVQKLLERCRAPFQSEKSIEDDNRRDWYPSWKLPFIRPCIFHLLYQPLREVPTVDGNVHAEKISSQAQWGIKLQGIISTGESLDICRSLTTLASVARVYVMAMKAKPMLLGFTGLASDYLAGMTLINRLSFAKSLKQQIKLLRRLYLTGYHEASQSKKGQIQDLSWER